ncbi:MAG: heme exporter protein CcmD [Gammaproteobacteria bacterium]|nr:heme exporter protein CcmD [Gammaproteobacteria bacterium]
MMEIFAMGKYGAYVWSSFALMFMVMIACVVQARSRHRKMFRQIESRLKSQALSEKNGHRSEN